MAVSYSNQTVLKLVLIALALPGFCFGTASQSRKCTAQDCLALIRNSDLDGLKQHLEENPSHVNLVSQGQTPLIEAISHNRIEIVDFLLEQEAIDLNKVNGSSFGPLAAAIMHNHDDITKKLLEKGADPNQTNNYNHYSTSLMYAMLYQPDDVDLIQLLLKHKANPLQSNTDKSNALHLACQNGQSKIVKILVDHIDDKHKIDIADNLGWTPLLRAVERGSVDCVVILKNAGASTKSKTFQGGSFLHLACRSGNSSMVQMGIDDKQLIDQLDKESHSPLYYCCTYANAVISKMLLDAGANPNLGTENGTPLCIASQNGHAEVVELLLKNKADCNLSDKHKNTPLHSAVQGQFDYEYFNGYPGFRDRNDECVELLVKSGANCDQKNSKGETPFEIAIRMRAWRAVDAMIARMDSTIKLDLPDSINNVHAIAEKGLPNLLKVFLEADRSQVNLASEGGQTPLLIAAATDKPESINILIEFGADLNAVDESGQNALHVAAWAGNVEVAKTLLQSEIEVESKSHSENTALHAAVWQGSEKMVRLLLDHQANVDAADSDGFTPLHKTVIRGNLAIARMLAEHGAKLDAKSSFGSDAMSLAESQNNTELVNFLREFQSR